MSNPDLLVWVHTCPQRAGKLQSLLDSLSASDTPSFEVHVCDVIGPAAVEVWNREKLLEISRRAEWIVRLEDDVIVGSKFYSNLSRWPAIHNGQDFGVGLLHLNQVYWEDPVVVGRMRRDRASGSLWLDSRLICGAQGQVFNSKTYREKIYPLLPRMTGGEMDIGMTAAAYDAGLRTYVAFPDLIDQSAVAAESIIGHPLPERFYMSKNFDPAYEYDGSSLFDKRPFSVTGDFYSAYFVNAKKCIVDVSVPLGPASLPIGPVWVKHNGAPVLAKGKNIFWSLDEAKQFAGPSARVVR